MVIPVHITVRQHERSGFKILVNGIQRGCILHSLDLANNMALELKKTFYPWAEISLLQE